MRGYQDLIDEAPLELVYVNVYLYAVAHGLATVIRAWIDRDAIAEARSLTPDQQVLFSQTVGYPKQ